MSCPTCNQIQPTTTCVECNPIVCPTPNPCADVISTDCVVYPNVSLGCHVNEPIVLQNGSLSSAIANIISYFCEHTHTPIDKYAGTTLIYEEGDDVNTALESIVDYFQDLISNLPSPTGATIVDKTHAEMVLLQSSGTLAKGQWYRITDFATMYEQPDYDATNTAVATPTVKTSAVEPIIVFALSTTALAPTAFQTAYVKDVVEYELNYTTPITNTATLGRITKRTDEFGNKSTFDHRTVLFKRYLDTSGDYSSIYDLTLGSSEFLALDVNTYTCENNILYFTENNTFDLPNCVFLESAQGNRFDTNISNATFVKAASQNTFKDLRDSVFTELCENNLITWFNLNTINSNFYGNKSDYFENNVITANFKHNKLDYCEGNDITASVFQHNNITSFHSNIITNGGNSSYNVISSFTSNTITGYMLHNSFQGTVSNNQLVSMYLCSGSIFSTNVATGILQHLTILYPIISVDFSAATLVYGDYTKKIYKNQGSVLKLSYYDSFDSEQTALITD